MVLLGVQFLGGGRAYAYVNIGEPPITRTLMGYIPGSVLEEKLPKLLKD